MRTRIAKCGETLLLGVQGENQATEIRFDLTAFIQQQGEGTAVLLTKRAQDEAPTPAVVVQEGRDLSWIVTDYDTNRDGYGACILRWYTDTGLAKSMTWRTWVSSDAVGENPPSPPPSWVDEVIRAAEEAKQSADGAAKSAEDAAKSVLDAESWAVGGTGTRPGEDEDNAKYWAEKAAAALADADKLRGTGYAAVCHDEAASPTSEPNTWYIPKTMPKPSGEVGMMVDVLWKLGRVDGLGYDVSLVWGEPGGADNEVIVEAAGVSSALTGEYSIPAEGTVRYQLIDQSGRKRWQYVSGQLIPRQYSTDAEAATADKPVHGLQLGYLPGMEIFVQLDKGNSANLMRLVPDEGETLPVYGNGVGAKTGALPAGYILHLKNAGAHWQIINQPGTGGGGGGGAVDSVNGQTGVVVLTADDVGAATPAQLNEAKHTTMVVTAMQEGGSGYKADHTSTEIINHANAGGIVVLRYTEPTGRALEIRMSGQTPDRQAWFFQTFKVPGENKVERVDATVDYAGNVALKKETIDVATRADLSEAIGALGTVFDYKGSKPSKSALPSTGNKTGDVWFVEDESVGYIWLDSGKWEPFGPAIDLSGYLAKPAGTTEGQFAVFNADGSLRGVTLPNLDKEAR